LGATNALIAIVLPENATNKAVVWSSSNISVADVDENGVVTAVGNGTAIIIAATVDGGYKATCEVKVNITSSGNNYSSGSSGGGGRNQSTNNNNAAPNVTGAALLQVIKMRLKGKR